METLRDVIAKLRQYSFSEVFTYTGVSRWRIVWQLMKLPVLQLLGVQYVLAKVNDYRMKLDLKTPGLSKALYVYGRRELPDTYVAQEIIQPGMVVADIGANIGYYTLLEALAVGDKGHVYAYEPDPRNIPLLQENIKLNGLEDRVTVYDWAVSDVSETKLFQLGERSNVSSFVDRPDVVDTVEVSCVALHKSEHINEIDMLRMDAEGYECQIIAGALPFLRSDGKPFKIMLEVHNQEYNDTDMNFRQNLQDLFLLGFKVTHLIVGIEQQKAVRDLGYESVGRWTETKFARDLYLDIKNEDVLQLLDKQAIRSLVLSR